ncbi:ABC transporter substrate-binding protein [Shimwellia pseudoproteus]|uniref:ABC transporter substrate-binding protein n=1 Tax=Shimwellia pseudoproteus TaxID=570012 RepID=UPI0018ECB9DB|nr:ABC transporter substrate-binding protein [Shimwellia pseudoproteus]
MALFLCQNAIATVVDLSGAPAYPAIYRPVESPPATTTPDLVLLGIDLVEITVALGMADHILARPARVDLPGIANTPHKIRDWAGVEGVLALRPGKVVGSSVVNIKLLNGLQPFGITTKMVDRTLPAREKIRRMAALLGHPERGEALVASLDQDYREAQTFRLPGQRPLRLMHLSRIGAGNHFTAGGRGTAVDNLIRRVGAINATAEIGNDRYTPITPEGIIAAAPDVIIVSVDELPALGGADTIWATVPGLNMTPAGRQHNLIIMRDLQVRADAASSGIATRTLAKALKDMVSDDHHSL